MRNFYDIQAAFNSEDSEHHSLINYLIREKITERKLTVIIQELIQMEKVNLAGHKILKNWDGCMRSRHTIADARIFLLALSGDLQQ